MLFIDLVNNITLSRIELSAFLEIIGIFCANSVFNKFYFGYIAIEPSVDYEETRRRIETNIHELWFYVRSQIINLQQKENSQLLKNQFNAMADMISQYKRYYFIRIFSN